MQACIGEEGERLLRKAATTASERPRIKQNLALALSLRGDHQEAVKVASNASMTEAEARAQYQSILDHQDPVAADNFYKTFAGGDQTSWKNNTREQWVIGGNVHVIGTPEQVVDGFVRLSKAGCDGVQVNFYDFLPDLDFFGRRVVPLMRQAGLRN